MIKCGEVKGDTLLSNECDRQLSHAAQFLNDLPFEKNKFFTDNKHHN
jgi:hypothetical protein